MKKILLALALVCSLQAAYAQKSDAEMQKAVEKALAATQDAKKATKPAVWMALGKAYMTAYTNPIASVTQGIDQATFAMMNKEKPSAVEDVVIEGMSFQKQTFSHYDVYFNAAGQLAIINVTHPSVEGDLLGEAAKAYAKAFELGAKDKDVDPRLQEIATAYYNDAFTAYSLGDLAKASKLFKGAADVSTTAPCSVPNNDAAYNAAFTAKETGNYNLANEYYQKCLANGYTSEGNIYASLAECSLAQKDTLSAKNFLANGLTAYPDNGAILTSLINLYLQTNEDPKKIVELLDEAKKAMPDNASLYYVEGNIYVGIKDYESAISAYDKALEKDPNYDFAYYGKGNVALKKGEDLVEQMNALDVREYKKYDELQAKLVDVYAKEAIPAFEQCYEVSKMPEVKAAAADYLKRLNFQLRGLGEEYKAAYEKWDAIVNAAAAAGQQ